MGEHTNSAPEDIKAKMREALARKQGNEDHPDVSAEAREKAHGSEVSTRNVGPQNTMHRRKAGGGGS